jgi:Domain of unknown function (DUF5615)
VKLLLDEMIPSAVAVQLRRRGYDVVAVSERPDLRSLPDAQVFAAAQAEGRVVVTRDRVDYLGIDRAQREAGLTHAGLVLVSSRFPEPAVGRLVNALTELLAGDAAYPGVVHWL